MTDGRQAFAGVLWAPALTLLALTIVPATALSQGNGIKADRFQVHPELKVEGGYDGNFYRNEGNADGPTVGVAYMRPTVGIRVENPNPGKIGLAGHAGLEYRHYFTETINDEQGRLGWDLGLDVELGVGQPFSVTVAESFSRQLEPGRSDPLSRDQDTPACGYPCQGAFVRNQTDLGIKLAPGGGRLEVRPGYRFETVRYDASGDEGGYQFFDDSDNPNDTTLHHLSLDGNWRFFPKTAVVLQFSLGFKDYIREDSMVPDSMPLRATLGLRGLITAKLSVDLGAGYGSSFHDSGDSFGQPIGRLVLSYRISELIKARIGYDRDFRTSALSNWYSDDRGLAGLQATLTDDFSFGLSASASFRGFSQVDLVSLQSQGVRELGSAATEGRSDQHIAVDAGFEWSPTEVVIISLRYQLEMLNSNSEIARQVQRGTDIIDVRDPASYLRNQVFVGVGVVL